MKIQFNGTSAVLAPGTDDVVEPGDVIDVAADIGASLLTAGTAYPADGPPVPPESPLWSLPAPAPAKTKKED